MKRYFTILTLLLTASMLVFSPGCAQKKKKPMTTLSVNSIPQGAMIYVDGQEMSETPIKLSTSPGKHIVKATKQNFKQQLMKVVCSSGVNTTLEIPLEQETASILIETVPQGAEVILKGETIGETPLVLYNQNVGTHTAILKKIGYVNKEITWEVSDERPRLVQEKLISNLGTLTIRTEPSNAIIFVDGKQSGNTPYSSTLPEGNHTVKLTLGGYSVYEQTILVLRDKTVTRVVPMQLLPGSVAISSDPPGAFVYINDKQYENTPCEIKDLKPGSYKLKLQRPGYDPLEKNFNIRPDEKTTIAGKLDSNTGRIHLVTCPAGISIYIDGQAVGKTEPGEHKDVSKVFEINNVSMGKHIIKLAHKLARPNSKSITVKVNKGETKRLTNIKMWIADTELLLKDGKTYVGRLESENADSVMFEIEPGVTQHYDKAEIKSMKNFEVKEE